MMTGVVAPDLQRLHHCKVHGQKSKLEMAVERKIQCRTMTESHDHMQSDLLLQPKSTLAGLDLGRK